MLIDKILQKQNRFFNKNYTKDINFRKNQLLKLKNLIKQNEKNIYLALKQDLNKSEYESYLTEIGMVYTEINYLVKNLDKLCKKEKVFTPISNFPAKSYILKEPYGSVLILSPWNYPIQLSLLPLAGAIAGGNCVFLSCSPQSKFTSDLIRKMINEAFAQEYIYCIEENESYEDLLSLKYDYIFFTGSQRVGKIIMEAAAKNLTPFTLELGGKSPCFIDKSADLDLAAKRIVWGKTINSGQTCIAPDYLLVNDDIAEEFIDKILFWNKKLIGNVKENKNYPKIINKNHFNRLCSIVNNSKDVLVGEIYEDENKISLCVIDNCNFNSISMEDEIFGPILPIIRYKDLNNVINEVKLKDKPLACYIFSNNKSYINKILNEVSFGGGCVNDTVMHIANHNLPFGGVGSSGTGNYHGKKSFKTFTHEKSILHSLNFIDVPLRYQPYKDFYLKVVKKIIK